MDPSAQGNPAAVQQTAISRCQSCISGARDPNADERHWARAGLCNARSGAPLPFDRTSVGRSAVVTVIEDAATGGQFWIRQYGRATGFPQMVGSSKRFAGPTGLEEYIGFGIGISLKLKSKTNGLYFLSDRYFLKLGHRRLPLPRWACPGALVVGHEELGGGQFRFTLELTHPLFGQLIWQDATFRDAEIVGSEPL